MKNIYFILLSIVVILYIIMSVRKNNLSVKNSFGWFILCIIMLFLSIWPKSLDFFAELINISYPPALFLTLCVIVLLIINFNHSKKINKLNEKVIDLAQELSIIKEEQKTKSR